MNECGPCFYKIDGVCHRFPQLVEEPKWCGEFLHTGSSAAAKMRKVMEDNPKKEEETSTDS